ncbi:MAG TPA: type II toxin-antitoxin system ParD family antitoxin [Polyangiaceae bacterium]|nr:type II toxin-antitoxin system ParD family antitoxin [Polyangiaceae bacterium]
MSHVELPEDLVRLAEAQVAAGRASDLGEVLRLGLAVIERRRQRKEQELFALREALAEGDASPDFQGDPFATVRAEFGLSK